MNKNFIKLPEKITVLFIASNPDDQSKLQLDEEIRLITNKIRESKYRDSIELKSIWATRSSDLLQVINEYSPTIVHFSGHGSDKDELILQDETGKTVEVKLETIVTMFETVSENIKLIVFNTCFSKNQANKIIEHIPSAIGMNTSIGDVTARIFSSQLYSSIGFGLSIDDSFKQAKVAIMLERLEEENTPQLYLKKGLDGKKLFFVKASDSEKTNKEFVFYINEEKITYEEKMISLEKDIVKIYAHSHSIGVQAEYKWINHKYPNSKTLMQSLTSLSNLTKKNTKRKIYFDIVKIELSDKRIKEIYFDISEFVRSGMVSTISNSNSFMTSKLEELYSDDI